MSKTIKILIFSGSTREGSVNKKLAQLAHQIAQAHTQVEAIYLDLKDYPMPLYDGDLESSQGLPKGTVELAKLMAKADGFVLTSPEYNGLLSPLLKNTFDWLSRSKEPVFTNQVATIMSASPGQLGGFRGLNSVRSLLTNLGVVVSPKQFALGGAFSAFDAEGQLKDQKKQAQLQATLEAGLTLNMALKT